MGALVTKCGKQMAPHLKTVVPIWWLGCFDTNSEAASASLQALQTAFPQGKWKGVLSFCRVEIISTLVDFLEQDSQQLTDLKQATPEEAQERQQRVHAQSLSGLREMILATHEANEAGQTTSAKDNAAAREIVELVHSSTVDLPPTKSPLKQCFKVKTSSPAIRSAAYSLVTTLAIHTTDDSTSKSASGSLDTTNGSKPWLSDWASLLLASSLGEKEGSCLESAWRLVLCLTKHMGNVWEAPGVDLRKSLLPKLCSQLKNAAYGRAICISECVLPLVATMPPHIEILGQVRMLPFSFVDVKLLKLPWCVQVADSALDGAKNAIQTDKLQGQSVASMLSIALDISIFVVGSIPRILEESKDDDEQLKAMLGSEVNQQSSSTDYTLETLIVQRVWKPYLNIALMLPDPGSPFATGILDASLFPFLNRLTSSSSETAKRLLRFIATSFVDFAHSHLGLDPENDGDPAGAKLVQTLVCRLHENEGTRSWSSSIAVEVSALILDKNVGESTGCTLPSAAQLETLSRIVDCYGVVCLTHGKSQGAFGNEKPPYETIAHVLRWATVAPGETATREARIRLAIRCIMVLANAEKQIGRASCKERDKISDVSI